MRERLARYYQVMMDAIPAKFVLAKALETTENPYHPELTEDELWKLHDSLAEDFSKLVKEVDEGRRCKGSRRPEYSYLDVKVALARRLMDPCRLCEWRCGARRLHGGRGACFMRGECIVHTYFLHMGEEAPLVPSGTVFYGGCNFRCVYCQNSDISQVAPEEGVKVTPRELAGIQERLRDEGARNINHVGGEPTPHLPFIIESFKHLEVNVPQIWNSNMYMSVESMKLLKDLIDLWLPDLKYGNNSCAYRYSRVRRYWEVVTRNILEAYRSGEMIIRHLVLPNHVECCTRRVLEWIAGNTPEALVNIMGQYRPEHLVLQNPGKWPEISRPPTQKEMREAYRIAEELGVHYKPLSFM